MLTIENELLRVSFLTKGAELSSIYHKGFQLEYLWNADPAFWPKHSPVLFPIVGALKENTYFYNNLPYKLARHGFAREKEFSVAEQSRTSITFSLLYDEETLFVYPFQFELRIIYTINENSLRVRYEVKNLQDQEMYFSIGAHPAFKVPLVEGTIYDDYYLEFNRQEEARRWHVSPDGLIEAETSAVFADRPIITLNKNLFLQDALVFKDLTSDAVTLKSNRHEHGLQFFFQGFPFMGLWAAKQADFLCIEPWCGIADGIDTDQQLKNKEGMIRLAGGESVIREWSVSLY